MKKTHLYRDIKQQLEDNNKRILHLNKKLI